ncbi:small membrane protein [Klebsiella michiganensis]|nr:small membrane protein [Klebsiella michiganensis]NRE85370.1 small membrane protein [Klebsiella michiganensis]QTN53198.1 small membrane protein [Klebsiella michiganensis]
MSNLLMLALAIALLLIGIGFLVSYIRDKKRYKNTFKNRRR